MSQGVVFYDNDTFMVPFFIYEGEDKYIVSFDTNQKYDKTEQKQLEKFKRYLNACNLKNFNNNDNGNLTFDITIDEYNTLTKPPSPITNMSVKNTGNINTILNDLSWHLASPPSKGGRRKTKRGKPKYRTTKKLHRRVRRR